jgi:hypothetical protein
MNENPNTFVTCASGSNPFTDCLIRRSGSRIRLIGYSQMEFTKAEALALIKVIKDVIKEIENDPT